MQIGLDGTMLAVAGDVRIDRPPGRSTPTSSGEDRRHEEMRSLTQGFLVGRQTMVHRRQSVARRWPFPPPLRVTGRVGGRPHDVRDALTRVVEIR
jgi:hypothetical protein